MGKVLFSQVSVCSHFGGYPHLAKLGGIPIQLTGGYPIWPMGGGTPIQLTWGYPILLTGVTPSIWMMGVVTPSSWQWVPPLELDCSTPHRTWMGYPPPHQETEQQSKHLLRSRWYASCVHAGGISCVRSKNTNYLACLQIAKKLTIYYHCNKILVRFCRRPDMLDFLIEQSN